MNLYICIFIYIYKYINIYIFIYTYRYIGFNIYMNMYTYIYIHLCMNMHIHTNNRRCATNGLALMRNTKKVCQCVAVRLALFRYARICEMHTHSLTHNHTLSHTHTNTHIHTHTTISRSVRKMPHTSIHIDSEIDSFMYILTLMHTGSCTYRLLYTYF